MGILVSIENVLHFHQRQRKYISTQEKLCFAIMQMITVVHGYVVLYLTFFETLIILKIDGNKENCYKDGISTICSKIISFRKLWNFIVLQ